MRGFLRMCCPSAWLNCMACLLPPPPPAPVFFIFLLSFPIALHYRMLTGLMFTVQMNLWILLFLIHKDIHFSLVDFLLIKVERNFFL